MLPTIYARDTQRASPAAERPFVTYTLPYEQDFDTARTELLRHDSARTTRTSRKVIPHAEWSAFAVSVRGLEITRDSDHMATVRRSALGQTGEGRFESRSLSMT